MDFLSMRGKEFGVGNRSLNIGLLIVGCKSNNNYYCIYNNKNRWNYFFEILDDLKRDNDKLDFLITSNNFFSFNNKCNLKKIHKKILKKINNKRYFFIKNIIMGIDYCIYGNAKKNIEKVNMRNGFGGIRSNIFRLFYSKKEKKFILKNSILECWPKCRESCFKRQYRYFKYNNVTFGLLSCGDFLLNCNKNGKFLEKNVDIYIDLTHKGYRRYKQTMKALILKVKPKYVIFNQQVSHYTLNTYKDSSNFNNYIYSNSCQSRLVKKIIKSKGVLFLYKVTL